MPLGRPSKYDPAFCEVAYAKLAEGYSVLAVAAEIGVNKTTLYEWADKHPEFSNALKTGQGAAAAWWEARLRDIASGEPGNATAAIFGLKNRARDEWADVTRNEHTGADGGPIETADVSPRAKLADFLGRRAPKSG